MSSGGTFPAIVAMLVSIANIVWTWHMRSQSAAADRVKQVEIRLDLVEDRQLTVEGELRHLPTKEDVHGLKVQLADVLGVIGRQGSEITAMARAVNRIDDYLLRERT